jgi:hypothetical protein
MKYIQLNSFSGRIIRYVWTLILVFCLFFTPQPGLVSSASFSASTSSTESASEIPTWALVVATEIIPDENATPYKYDELFMVNSQTNEIKGPFLRDELTPIDEESGYPTGGDVFDIVITPDGETALISSFKSHKIHFVDITDPLSPKYLSYVQLQMFTEDLAITSDGRYVLATGGAFSNTIASVNIASRMLIQQFTLPDYYDQISGELNAGWATGVAVGPDGTVIAVDYINGLIHSLRIGSDGNLTYSGTHAYFVSQTGDASLTYEAGYDKSQPINAAISPDGQTVLVSETWPYNDTTGELYSNNYGVGVYKVTAPGELEFVKYLNNLPRSMGNIVFDETGKHAIMSGNGGKSYDATRNPKFEYYSDGVYLLDINGPGDVEINIDLHADLQCYTEQHYFMDSLAISKDKAFVTYLFNNDDTFAPLERYLSIVDLTDFTLTQISLGPSEKFTLFGVAVIPLRKSYMPVIQTSAN